MKCSICKDKIKVKSDKTMKLTKILQCECGRVHNTEQVKKLIQEIEGKTPKRGRPRKHEKNYQTISSI